MDLVDAVQLQHVIDALHGLPGLKEKRGPAAAMHSLQEQTDFLHRLPVRQHHDIGTRADHIVDLPLRALVPGVHADHHLRPGQERLDRDDIGNLMVGLDRVHVVLAFFLAAGLQIHPDPVDPVFLGHQRNVRPVGDEVHDQWVDRVADQLDKKAVILDRDVFDVVLTDDGHQGLLAVLVARGLAVLQDDDLAADALHQLLEGQPAVVIAQETGEVLDLDIDFLAGGLDLIADVHRHERVREDHSFDLVLFDMVLQLFQITDNRNAVQDASRFGTLVCEDARDPDRTVGILLQLSPDDPGRFTRADQHDVDGGFPGQPALFLLNEPVEEADQTRRDKLDHRADHIIGDRHADRTVLGMTRDQRDDRIGDADMSDDRDEVRADDAVQVMETGILPHAAVEPEDGKDCEGHNDIDGDKGPEIILIVRAVAEDAVDVHPDVEGCQVGQHKGNRVQQKNPDIVAQEVSEPFHFRIRNLPL